MNAAPGDPAAVVAPTGGPAPAAVLAPIGDPAAAAVPDPTGGPAAPAAVPDPTGGPAAPEVPPIMITEDPTAAPEAAAAAAAVSAAAATTAAKELAVPEAAPEAAAKTKKTPNPETEAKPPKPESGPSKSPAKTPERPVDIINLNENVKNNIQIYGVVYTEKGKFGDFEWMVDNGYRDNTLYIFNDNTGHHNTNKEGSGNGVMRRYNKHRKINNNNSIDPDDDNRNYSKRPLSAGLSTGIFEKFEEEEQKIILKEYYEIIEILNDNYKDDKNKYKYIYCSVEFDETKKKYTLGADAYRTQTHPDSFGFIYNLITKLSSNPIIIYNYSEKKDAKSRK